MCERHCGPGLGERDRGLERGVASAHDQRVPPREVGRIVQAVVHLVERLARNAKPAEVAAPPDRDQHARGLERAASGELELEAARAALDPLHARDARHEAEFLALRLELLDERLLDVGRYAQLAGRLNGARVRVDRLSLREVDQRRERARGLEELESESDALRLGARREAGHAGADDDEREHSRRCRAAREIRGDRAGGARPGVERELEQRNPGQIPADVKPGHGRRAARADPWQRLDLARGPAEVQPVRIARQDAGQSDLAVRTCARAEVVAARDGRATLASRRARRNPRRAAYSKTCEFGN